MTVSTRRPQWTVRTPSWWWSRPKVASPPAVRPVWFGDGWADTPVHAGAWVTSGTTMGGPALVGEPFTVVVVPPGWSATLADHAAYELRR